jgi:hypothetical protein
MHVSRIQPRGNALAEITGQNLNPVLEAVDRSLYFLSVGFLQEEGLRFQLRSWRVDTGSRTPER